MLLKFTKYQGTGNDFILIDNRQKVFPKDTSLIKKLTDRKFGIGADGLMLIEDDPQADFKMIYYNSDGSQSLCGNGSRCAVDFARSLGIIRDKTQFTTTDGVHEASIHGWVHFQLHPVDDVIQAKDHFFIHNGSPHHMIFCENVEAIDVVKLGSEIRYSEEYHPDGTNVNFVEILDDKIKVRTYERGVEDETLSCGTGVVASALAASFKGLSSPVDVETQGGNLSVSFEKDPDNCFKNIYLAGPVERVFEGEIEIGSRV